MDEHFAAPNDAACLDETAGGAPDDFRSRWATLSATPPQMPPEVRAVAALRDKLIPGLDVMAGAWGRLPAASQDRIGTQAIALAFYGWLSGDSCQDPTNRWITDAAAEECDDRANTALNLIHALAGTSLPELYGTKEHEPEWSRVDGGHHPAPVAMDWRTNSPPTPINLAIALHRRTWGTLQAGNAFLTATGKADRKKLVWPAADAEDEALTDLLMLSARSRQDATDMVAHLRWYLGVG